MLNYRKVFYLLSYGIQKDNMTLQHDITNSTLKYAVWEVLVLPVNIFALMHTPTGHGKIPQRGLQSQFQLSKAIFKQKLGRLTSVF